MLRWNHESRGRRGNGSIAASVPAQLLECSNPTVDPLRMVPNSSGYVACVGWSRDFLSQKTIHSSTSYSSISILKYSATRAFSAFAHSESSMKRTAPSRPRSPALGLSPFAATGVSGCTAGAAAASLSLSLSLFFSAGRSLPSLAPSVGLESLLSSTQCVYRGNLWASASLFSGMRTVRNRSGGKCGPTVVELRLCVYNSSRSKSVSGFVRIRCCCCCCL